MAISRVNDPLQTKDSTLLVASTEDLLATKLKAILDRAEAKDYRDIVAVSVGRGFVGKRVEGRCAKMYDKDYQALPLGAIELEDWSRMAMCRPLSKLPTDVALLRTRARTALLQFRTCG